MVGTHRGVEIPLSVYHGVPRGWHAHEIVEEHAKLHPTHELIVPDATEPGAPSWLPERKEWLQYRAALYEVVKGISNGDSACIELAIRFIELRYIGSYSGFIRERLARRLANAQLNNDQKSRLHLHFAKLVLDQERTDEYRAYVKVWRRIITSAQRAEVLANLCAAHGEQSAAWLAEKLETGLPHSSSTRTSRTNSRLRHGRGRAAETKIR